MSVWTRIMFSVVPLLYERLIFLTLIKFYTQNNVDKWVWYSNKTKLCEISCPPSVVCFCWNQMYEFGMKWNFRIYLYLSIQFLNAGLSSTFFQRSCALCQCSLIAVVWSIIMAKIPLPYLDMKWCPCSSGVFCCPSHSSMIDHYTWGWWH